MANESTPPSPSPAGLPPDGRSQIAGGQGMFSSTLPDRPSKTPTQSDMDRASMSPDQRFRSNAERAAEYARSYDRPAEAKPATPVPRQDQPSGEQPAADQTDELKQLADYRAWQSKQLAFQAELPTPDSYKVQLPTDLKLPDGIEFKFNPDDPLIGQAKSWAHKNGLTQAQFEEALALHAGTQIGVAQQIKAAREAEVAQLGATGPARIDAVVGWLNSVLGKELSGEMQKMLVTARMVDGFEKIIGRFTSQGASSLSANREPNQSRGPSDSEWESWNYNQRRAYQQEVAAASQPRRR